MTDDFPLSNFSKLTNYLCRYLPTVQIGAYIDLRYEQRTPHHNYELTACMYLYVYAHRGS
jgi:hypothetical protein